VKPCVIIIKTAARALILKPKRAMVNSRAMCETDDKAIITFISISLMQVNLTIHIPQIDNAKNNRARFDLSKIVVIRKNP